MIFCSARPIKCNCHNPPLKRVYKLHFGDEETAAQQVSKLLVAAQLVKIKGRRKEYPQVQIQVFGLQSLGSGQGDWLSQWALLVWFWVGNSIKTAFWWREEILKNYWSLIKVLVVQSCLTLHDTMDFGPPGSSLCGIFQAWILEWVAIPFPRDIPSPGIKARSPVLQVDSLPSEPPGVSHCLKLNTPGSWESV